MKESTEKEILENIEMDLDAIKDRMDEIEMHLGGICEALDFSDIVIAIERLTDAVQSIE